MVHGGNGEILRNMDRLFGEGSLGGVSPGRLLERFATGRDPGAFGALVERFGPMVLGLCRRMLDDPHVQPPDAQISRGLEVHPPWDGGGCSALPKNV